jgi:hypothetical protein
MAWFDAPEFASGPGFFEGYQTRYGESPLVTIDNQQKSGLSQEDYALQNPNYVDLLTRATRKDSNESASAQSVLNNLNAPAYQRSDLYKNLSEEDKSIVNKQQFQQKYGGMGAASLADFKTLLDSLEASKIRQQEGKDISARPGIYAQGLAAMMNKF